MPNPNAVVSRIVRFDPPLDRAPAEVLRDRGAVLIELENGQLTRVEPTNLRAAGLLQILDGLSRQRMFVYLELDPDTGAVTRLLIPHVARVFRLYELEDGALGVELELSQARHVLQRSHPDFAAMEGQLREAVRSGDGLIVTEDDAHNIIDIRSFTPGLEGHPAPLPKPFLPPSPLPRRNWFRRLLDGVWDWLFGWFRCVSMTRAQGVFNTLAAASCDPQAVAAPCIPFLYPDDGCWARAHEMVRLMQKMGLSPKKVWIQGTLRAATRNHRQCFVHWGWHVAPVVCVRGPGLFRREEMVLDPALFAGPVSKATWMAAQGDPNATLTSTAGEIFYFWGAVTDNGYVKTNQDLARFRLALQLRVLELGKPPYANCP